MQTRRVSTEMRSLDFSGRRGIDKSRFWQVIGPKPSRKLNVKFAGDYTLGKLAKSLRILGFDTLSFRELNAETVQVMVKEGRVMLTRNGGKKLVQTVPNSVFMDMNSPDQQLKGLIHLLDLKLDPVRFFSLCTYCNQKVTSIKKSLLRDQLPDYIWSTHNLFSKCPNCEKILEGKSL